MKKLIVFYIILVALNMAYAKKLGTLTDVINPYTFQVSDGKIFIAEGTNIYIYSVKDLKLERKFGKAGEGPAEFIVPPTTNMGNVNVDIYSDFISVTSFGKLSYFSKNGDFLKEIRTGQSWGCFKPLGTKFVGYGNDSVDRINYNTIKIFDSNLKQGKEFSRSQAFYSEGKEINPLLMSGPAYYVINNLVYVEENKDRVKVYDINGNLVSTLDINKGYKKIKVTQKDRDKYLDYFKTEPAFRAVYPIIKRDIKFFEYFPGIFNFLSAEEKLYIVRWTGSKGKRDIAEFDVNGKLLMQMQVPFYTKDAIVPYAYAFGGGNFYQLVENQDDEGKWDLLVEELK